MEPIVVNMNPPPPPPTPEPPQHPKKQINWKKIGIIIVLVLCVLVAVILTVKGYQSHQAHVEQERRESQREELKTYLENESFEVKTVYVNPQLLKTDPVYIDVYLEDDSITKNDYELMLHKSNEIYGEKVRLDVFYGEESRYTASSYENGEEPPKESESQTYTNIPLQEPKKTESAPKENPAPAPEPEPEPAKIWQRSQSEVIDALSATLSSMGYSLETYDTGQGTLYSLTGTGVGYMWMTDTVNGGKKPCVICSDVYDSVNARAFTAACVALVKECGDYSNATAQSKFEAIYNATPDTGNSINTTVDGTGYTLVIESGTTLFTAQKPS